MTTQHTIDDVEIPSTWLHTENVDGRWDELSGYSYFLLPHGGQLEFRSWLCQWLTIIIIKKFCSSWIRVFFFEKQHVSYHTSESAAWSRFSVHLCSFGEKKHFCTYPRWACSVFAKLIQNSYLPYWRRSERWWLWFFLNVDYFFNFSNANSTCGNHPEFFRQKWILLLILGIRGRQTREVGSTFIRKKWEEVKHRRCRMAGKW